MQNDLIKNNKLRLFCITVSVCTLLFQVVSYYTRFESHTERENDSFHFVGTVDLSLWSEQYFRRLS